MKMINVIIICSIFIGVVLFTFLLREGKIGSLAYTTLITIIILTGIALYGFDRLKELDLKNLKLILTEIKEVKKDVYAKAETVKKLGEEMAELTAFNVASVGRFAAPDLQEKMLKARDKIAVVLEAIGSDDSKIKEISKQIDDMVVHDLKYDLLSKVQEIIHDNLNKGENINRDKIYNETKKLLFENYERNKLKEYLESQKAYKPEIEPLLDQIDKFNKDKKL
jgi:hypothetical protein